MAWFRSSQTVCRNMSSWVVMMNQSGREEVLHYDLRPELVSGDSLIQDNYLYLYSLE